MAKIVYAALNVSKPTGGKARPASKSVIGPDGEKMRVYVVDASSSTFGQDLRAVFGKNVAEARRANKRVQREKTRASSGA